MSGPFAIHYNHLSLSDMKQGFAKIKLKRELKPLSTDIYTTRCILAITTAYILIPFAIYVF